MGSMPQKDSFAPPEGHSQIEWGRAPALLFLAVLAVAVVLLAGCGESEPSSAETFGQRLLEAEQQPEVSAEPASFISLCANCHDRLDRELDWRRERKLVFSHPAHFAQGIRCEACHKEFPHKPGRTLHVDVETCFVCHGTLHGQDGELASTDCETCHTPDIAPVTDDHSLSNWLLAEGPERAGHAQKALQQRLYCKMCHQETFCQDCHQVEMPHPEDWEVAHMPAAQENEGACDKCHTPEYCNACHHADFEKLPDWRRQHRTVVGDVGTDACFECHNPAFCADCHVRVGQDRGVLGGPGNGG